MSVAIQLPFALDDTNHIGTTSDPDVITQQQIDALVSVSPGERLMLPSYGVQTVATLFTPSINNILAASLSAQVRAAMATWMPNVTVDDIRITTPENVFGAASIEVDYTPAGISMYTVTKTATILIGGTVVEDTPIVVTS